MNTNSNKAVVAIGIGSALFVIIAMINIPTPVPNTSIQLQYAVQSLFSVIFGPIPGFLIGFIGHALKDAQYGNPWWTWVIASGLFGLILGFLKKKIRIHEGLFTRKDIFLFNIVQILANLFVWCVVAPYGDIWIYSEPANKVFTQGLVAAGINSLTVAIAGTLLLWAYAKRQSQTNSLRKD